jgi:hypothetical protein
MLGVKEHHHNTFRITLFEPAFLVTKYILYPNIQELQLPLRVQLQLETLFHQKCYYVIWCFIHQSSYPANELWTVIIL